MHYDYEIISLRLILYSFLRVYKPTYKSFLLTCNTGNSIRSLEHNKLRHLGKFKKKWKIEFELHAMFLS